MRRLRLEDVPESYMQPTVHDIITWLPGEQYDPALIALNGPSLFALLTQRAAESAGRAVSWRNFKVGAAALAVDLVDMRMGTLTGMNIKPAEDSPVNIHAEQVVLAKARSLRMTRVICLSVWGEPQADSSSGILSSTLHPCGLCRHMLCSPDIPEVTEQTLIMSGNGNFSNCEIYTPPELVEYHEARSDQRKPLLAVSLSNETLHDRAADEHLTFQYLRKWAEVYPATHPAPLLNGWYAAGAPGLPENT